MKIYGKHGYARDVVDSDILELSINPRSVDSRHSKHLGWKNHKEHVAMTFANSIRAISFCLKDGTLIASVGVNPSDKERVGHVWILGSKNSVDILKRKGKLKKISGRIGVARGAYEFMRASKDHFNWLFGSEFDHLVNIIETGNSLGHRWVKFLGASIQEHDSKFSKVIFSK